MKRLALAGLLLGARLAAASAEPAAEPPPHDSLSARLAITLTSPAPRVAAGGAAAEPAAADDVVVLPKFDVRESRITLDERDVLTTRGLLAAAKQRHLSPLYQKTFGPLAALAAVYFNPLSLLAGVRANDAEALTLYAQEERLRRIRDADALIDLTRLGDPAAARELQDALRESFRHDSFESLRH